MMTHTIVLPSRKLRQKDYLELDAILVYITGYIYTYCCIYSRLESWPMPVITASRMLNQKTI